jgi:hypothetical protein
VLDCLMYLPILIEGLHLWQRNVRKLLLHEWGRNHMKIEAIINSNEHQKIGNIMLLIKCLNSTLDT